ncbi:uncharacterized protein F5Z01DRAFT_433946 [Emericellopsis atlantica]|uniref:Uncharacterized protein n=1 Tax=Emericellopsis atlantica TaxID=2614577 RepID=A0A9P7ZDM2_9HYPO|nr:uncharacterized protein F5Z01DRAFT_433946 [Emericellopsis atlantica]KAG9249986.1 hypothetical protein F5Z01DRAFT_433946 [Emericellopsis atlantica]
MPVQAASTGSSRWFHRFQKTPSGITESSTWDRDGQAWRIRDCLPVVRGEKVLPPTCSPLSADVRRHSEPRTALISLRITLCPATSARLHTQRPSSILHSPTWNSSSVLRAPSRSRSTTRKKSQGTCLQRNVQKVQDCSRNASIFPVVRTSLPSQDCNAQAVSRAYNVDAISPPANESFSIGTALNMASPRDLSVTTRSIGVERHDIVPISESFNWGVGTANGCMAADPRLHTFSNQPEAGDMDGWSFEHAHKAY